MEDLATTAMATIVVTREMEFARAAADEVVFMSGGHIAEHGTPEEDRSNPQNERTRSFLARVL
jgi:polar amino acid transport system ATP-binding protein